MSLIELTTRLGASASALADYAGADASLALIRWCDACCAIYKEELVDAEPSAVPALQAQVRQLVALKVLAQGAVKTNGRI